MWLLTCDGDLWGHQPIWLRPGSGHLLGRTSNRVESGETIRHINHKSVSRKHATFHVAPNGPGDSARLHTRSEITITDGSKVGTFINGEKVCQTSKTLDRTEYTIKLGNYDKLFHLKWHPVVLSFTSLPKSVKARGDPIEKHRQKLEQTDIKLTVDYLPSQTTHVVGKKRNTPPGLQALLQGRWLLALSFVDALAKVTAKPGKDVSGYEQPCPLEQDFEVHWPKEDKHILPSAGEPNPMPDESLKPNPQRAELFVDYVFIFLSQAQYDTLLPVVTSGGGKAMLWDVEIGQTRADDVVGYVREVAGEKGNGDFRLSQQTGKGGIVVVRLSNKDQAWTPEFLTAIEMAIEQRAMEQNQFLSAILSVDASELRKPLVRESQVSNNGAATSPSPNNTSERQVSRVRGQNRISTPSVQEQTPESLPEQPQSQTQHPSQPPATMETTTRKKTRPVLTQSRFKDFGEIDPSQFTRPDSESPEPSQATPIEQSMQVDEPSDHEPTQQTSRKRPAPVSDDDGANDQNALMENMLQGAAAMKKRRLQKKDAGEGSSNATPEPEHAQVTTKKTSKKSKPIDVRAALEDRNRQEEEARRKDEESLREALQDVDISEVHAKVEAFDLPQREPLARRSQNESAGPSDRWNPAWNGRKNFKRFKRKGQNDDGPRLPRVIVSLEEVPRKSHGIGDEYWLNTPAASSKSQRKSKSQTQSQTQTQTSTSHQNGDDDPARFRRRLQNSRIEDEEAMEISEVFPDDEAPRGPNRQSTLQATPSQTLGTESQRSATGKRPAAQQDGPAAKRAKQSRPAPARETVTVDDDDDGLKFKRRRR